MGYNWFKLDIQSDDVMKKSHYSTVTSKGASHLPCSSLVRCTNILALTGFRILRPGPTKIYKLSSQFPKSFEKFDLINTFQHIRCVVGLNAEKAIQKLFFFFLIAGRCGSEIAFLLQNFHILIWLVKVLIHIVGHQSFLFFL